YPRPTGWHRDEEGPQLEWEERFFSSSGKNGRTHDPGGDPQNPFRRMDQSEISSLLNDVLSLFENHPGCESKINAILGELSKATGFDAGTIRDIVERFRSSGIVYTADIPNRGSSAGTGIGGVPSVEFSPGDNAEISARTMLGEIIHWAGMVG